MVLIITCQSLTLVWASYSIAFVRFDGTPESAITSSSDLFYDAPKNISKPFSPELLYSNWNEAMTFISKNYLR